MKITTIQDLNLKVEKLNTLLGFPAKPEYSTVGSFSLDWAYGGVRLIRYTSENGTEMDPVGLGYGSKKETLDRIQAFTHGIQLGLNFKKES